MPGIEEVGHRKDREGGTVILHSQADGVVPFFHSEDDLAEHSDVMLIEVGMDHRLADPEPLVAMLRAS